MRLHHATITFVILAFCACGKGEKSDSRSALNPALEAVQVDAAVKSDAAGVTTSTLSVASSNTQIVRASAASKIAGTQIAFLPGSFDTDTDVGLGEGKSIASKKNLAGLGFSPQTVVTAVGPAILVSWTYDEDSSRPFTLTVPAPAPPAVPAVPNAAVTPPAATVIVAEPGTTVTLPAPALALTESAANLVVLYIRHVPHSNERKVGLIGAKALAQNGATLTFQASSYGAYQAVYLSEVAPATVAENTTTDTLEVISVDPSQYPAGPTPVFTPTPSNGAAPEAFEISGPTVNQLVGAKLKISWDESKGASSYELRLDPVDPACANAPLVVSDIKGFSQTVDTPADGQNYVCVFAKNEVGAVAATNLPFAVKAERSPPRAPGKPKIEAAKIATLKLVFTWDAVADVGTAGIRNYHLEIGSTPGANDIAVSDPVALTDNIFGRNGKTYYARVQAVDKAGNASAWSESSDPITINTDEPGPLKGFSAATGTAAGMVKLTFDFSNGEAYKYQEVRVMRRSGTTAPASDCAGTPVLTLKTFTSGTIDDDTNANGAVFSYRLCVLDKSAYVLPLNTATNVQSGG